MPNANANPLLEDLESESYETVLASNLKKKNTWTGENQWTSEGYIARVLKTKCAGCGFIQTTLTGVFHVETTPSGKRHETRLSETALLQFPRTQPVKAEHTNQTVKLCIACLILESW